ncbi:DUF4215 domain-containing protein, partial [bacterium]|nr:DUF4215 domain-containing protein [bacterium]MBU1024418.1 DUF4215 domain-containing protein [bacterium]
TWVDAVTEDPGEKDLDLDTDQSDGFNSLWNTVDDLIGSIVIGDPEDIRIRAMPELDLGATLPASLGTLFETYVGYLLDTTKRVRHRSEKLEIAAASVCGDGIQSLGEECDDGNTVSGDGCSDSCDLEGNIGGGICGDGTQDLGEECDDGNTVSGDGCSATCDLEGSVGGGFCGDGTQDLGEECDDGNNVGGDGCTPSCNLQGNVAGSGVCGDGFQDLGEECDDGNNIGGDGCTPTCNLQGNAGVICGDGTQDLGEECDDGNTVSGDGCSDSCDLESGFCGDGTQDLGEECDDGNTVSGDGCSDICDVEDIQQLYNPGIEIIGSVRSSSGVVSKQSDDMLNQSLGDIAKNELKTEISRNTATLTETVNACTESGEITDLEDYFYDNPNCTHYEDSVLYLSGDVTLNLSGSLPSGAKTILIKDGNLHIKSNLTYLAGNENSFGVIVLGGDIYVYPNVTNIAGTFYAEGGVISVNVVGEYGEDLSASCDGNSGFCDRSYELRNQLYWKGLIATANTIGGSDSDPLKCPGMINCSNDRPKARVYDLAYLRTYHPSSGGDVAADAPGSASLIVEYDSRIQSNPPPLFESSNMSGGDGVEVGY